FLKMQGMESGRSHGDIMCWYHSTAQTAQHRQHSTAQHSTDSTAQHSTAQHRQHGTARHSTDSTAQHGTAQHSTAQHSTAEAVGFLALSHFPQRMPWLFGSGAHSPPSLSTLGQGSLNCTDLLCSSVSQAGLEPVLLLPLPQSS
uniref:Uncharacterized protein n=1 Tax=Mus spicilegus TaxID=10103 RepID=A0A8C6G6D0_MUSSI